jgi:hypothetical protein
MCRTVNENDGLSPPWRFKIQRAILKTGASTSGIAAAQSSAESWLPSDRRNISLSNMVRPDNRDARMHLVVIAPGHAFRHGAAVGPSRVRVADVAGGGARSGCGPMVRLLAVEYDGEPRGHQRAFHVRPP